MKANIKLEEYLNYIQSENFDVVKFNDEYMQYFYGKWNEKDTQVISKAIDNILNKQYCNSKPDSVNISRYNNAKTVDAYIKLNNFTWNVDMHIDKYVVVSYGKVSIFILEEFVEFIPEVDYSQYSLNEVKRMLINGNTPATESKLPAEITNLSVNDVRSEQKKVTTLMDDLKSQMEDVKMLRLMNWLKFKKK